MERIIRLIVGNPAILLWIALAAFVAGFAIGAWPAWYIQGLRLTTAKSELAAFVSTAKAIGEASQREADAKAKIDRKLKEDSDREYQSDIARLRADNQRLRNSRTSSSYVPAAPPGSRSPDLACFNRAELESALQRLDAGISRLVEEGDEDAVGLDSVKRWAESSH